VEQSTPMEHESNQITFAEFCQEWLEDVQANDPSTVELGHRFARKLLTQWLNVDEESDDLVFCDGTGDGGIDIAYLERGKDRHNEDDTSIEGDTWYLVQSKYGKAFQGRGTLLKEGQKVVETLDGQRDNLSSIAEDLRGMISFFRSNASELDRIKLIFATEKPLTAQQKRVLKDVLAMGQARLGPIFDVDSVSVEAIYKRIILEQPTVTDDLPTSVILPISGRLLKVSEHLVLGAVSLFDLYEFLRAYKDKTGDLDRLYEKNVRRFLGSRGRINAKIRETLETKPEQFGLYNNGITLVVTDFDRESSRTGTFHLIEPYIVNGCQTTRTIWEVFWQRLAAGGTGHSPEIEDWKERAKRGVVITKITRVGSEDFGLLIDITRYTNSQNAVQEKDFLALESNLQVWASGIAAKYKVFLEIQRGGWDSYRVLQRQKPNKAPLREYANVFDLMKVYGAGWLGAAGTASGENAAFLPGGAVYKRIITSEAGEEPFGADDLFAAYQLKLAADEYEFGRRAKINRGRTRFLFYFVAVKLLKDMLLLGQEPTNPKSISRAINRLWQSDDSVARDALLDRAVDVIDHYLTHGQDYSVYNEPNFSNVTDFMRSSRLGSDKDFSPKLYSLIETNKAVMGMKLRGQQSIRDQIIAIVKADK